MGVDFWRVLECSRNFFVVTGVQGDGMGADAGRFSGGKLRGFYLVASIFSEGVGNAIC